MPVFRFGQSWKLFHDLECEVDRLLHGVDMTFHGIRFGRQYPAINLYQLDEEYLLTAEVPGMRAEELDVSIAGGILTLKGTRAEPDHVPDDQFRRRERFHGAWQRSFSLPERVQEERLTAEFNNGILKVHLPKAAEGQPRQIPVTDGTD